MAEVVQAFTLTVSKFVSMLFQLNLGDDISVGAFLIASAVLGAIIGLLFSLIHVDYKRFNNDTYWGPQGRISDKGGRWTRNVD